MRDAGGADRSPDLDREPAATTLLNSELNIAFADAVTVRALRCELLAEHLDQDTSALDGRSALSVFRTVAEQNAGRRDSGKPDWEGIACAMDPLQWWSG